MPLGTDGRLPTEKQHEVDCQEQSEQEQPEGREDAGDRHKVRQDEEECHRAEAGEQAALQRDGTEKSPHDQARRVPKSGSTAPQGTTSGPVKRTRHAWKGKNPDTPVRIER